MKSLFMTAIACAVFSSHSVMAQMNYPVAKKIVQTETRFGTVIEDPYKWMENLSDPDVWSWIEEQKTHTKNVLDANLSDAFAARTLEFRKIKAEQTKITEAAKPYFAATATPSIESDIESMGTKEKRFIKWKQRQNSHRKIIDYKTESILFKLEAKPTHNGDLSRVVISQKADNKVVDILVVKFYTFIAWADDNSFFYVSDMDERIGGGKPGLFKHTVGEIQSEDELLLSGKSGTSDLTVHQVGKNFFAEVDGNIGTLQLNTGKVTNNIPVKGEIVEMAGLTDAEATIRSFEKANNGEFYKLRLRDGKRSLFLKEQSFVLGMSKKLSEDATVILGLKDASHVIGILNLSGELKMIPDLNDGTIDLISFENGILKLGFESYSQPRKIISYNLATGEQKTLASQTYPVEVEAEKIYYEASNGQQASLWVFKKKGITLTSKTPTILYGYGGFRASITPGFGMYESLPWIEKGGAFAVVTLPGSLDYGNSWYELAKVGGRTHSFDSFALAAKELFKRGWTSAEHIGMMGASNGGTLVAGTLQRHSEIFKAAIPIVGVLDLINFSLFTAGKYWTEDYGNPFKESDFKGIFPLSPYHQLQKRDYPATMVMTAEFDDRVVPMHSYKYLARLQEYNTSDAPMLLYNKEWGGHARASGSARESSRFVAAFYTFFSQQLGL